MPHNAGHVQARLQRAHCRRPHTRRGAYCRGSSLARDVSDRAGGRMKITTSVTAVLAISLGLGLEAGAQNPKTPNSAPPTSSRAQAAEHDVREFIRAAGESGEAEVAFAGIA